MRVYFSSRSYPELREVEAGVVRRGFIWLRAFWSAVRDPWFIGFIALQLASGAVGVYFTVQFADSIRGPTSLTHIAMVPAVALLLQLPAMTMAVTIGGDVLRPHLRAVHRGARMSCSSCGHDLTAQFDAVDASEPGARCTCPECGAAVPRSIHARPHRIPREHRAVPWFGPA